jgi:hypothetical protein
MANLVYPLALAMLGGVAALKMEYLPYALALVGTLLALSSLMKPGKPSMYPHELH